MIGNQNFEPLSSGHLANTHSESERPQKCKTDDTQFSLSKRFGAFSSHACSLLVPRQMLQLKLRFDPDKEELTKSVPYMNLAEFCFKHPLEDKFYHQNMFELI